MMLNQEFLRNARLAAQQAVADMADGELKTTAFGTILSRLLAAQEEGAVAKPLGRPSGTAKGLRKPAARPRGAQPSSLRSRVLGLKADGFFGSQRSLNDIRAELSAHGWHYELTRLSGTMQALVRQRELRRVQAADAGGKKVWKYSNY
ncbi:MAG: hypothetical protein ACLPXM_02515 [Terriglobales bacterium]